MNLEKMANEIGINTETLRSMFNSFLKATKEDLEKIDEAVRNGDNENLGSHAHHIKGAALNLELIELSETAKALEFAAKKNEKESYTSLRAKLVSQFQKEEQEIKKSVG